MKSISAKFRRWRDNSALAADESGTAVVEFAYLLPMLAALSSGGIETTNYVWTHTQVSELALHASDHASRMGRSAVLKNIPVTEADINDVLTGTMMQGESINLQQQGRVIISSLQQNSQGGQWIAWQRCRGRNDLSSSWGKEGEGKWGKSFKGMGIEKVTADKNEAVIFSEIAYKYEPLFPLFDAFVPEEKFSETAAFIVREDRDLSQIYPVPGVTKSTC